MNEEASVSRHLTPNTDQENTQQENTHLTALPSKGYNQAVQVVQTPDAMTLGLKAPLETSRSLTPGQSGRAQGGGNTTERAFPRPASQPRPRAIPHFTLTHPKFRYEVRQGKLYRFYCDGSSSVVGEAHDPLRGAGIVAALEVLGVRGEADWSAAWRVLVSVTQLEIWADGRSCPLPRMVMVRKLLACHKPTDRARLLKMANDTERELVGKLLSLLNDQGRMDRPERRAAGRRVTCVRSR